MMNLNSELKGCGMRSMPNQLFHSMMFAWQAMPSVLNICLETPMHHKEN